jgi:peptide/nickel transport system permease protein
MVGIVFGGLLSGAVLVEIVFAWPGIGLYTFNALLALDLPAIMGVTLVIGVVYTLLNLLVDLIYRILDPRIKYA